MFTKTDFSALVAIQQSLVTLQSLMDDTTNVNRDKLADVWNALLDARGSIIDKMFDDDVMSFAGFEDDIRYILEKKSKRSTYS